MTSQFSDMTLLSIFSNVALFLLSNSVTGPGSMSISSLVLELWQFPFIRDWPDIWKSEIPSSDFCLISGDWGELGIPIWHEHLEKMLLNGAKCQGYSFYRFWVIKGKSTGGRGQGKTTFPSPRLGLVRTLNQPNCWPVKSQQ